MSTDFYTNQPLDQEKEIVYSLKEDNWISRQAQLNGMIEPFCPQLIRELDPGFLDDYAQRKVISYGLSSYGYDLRLSPNDFRIFRHVPGTVVDPKNFTTANLEPVSLQSDHQGDFFIIPAHSYGLGVVKELVRMPSNTMAICIGKSTYCRTGIIANTSPIESGWRGHITIELSNSSNADCRVYANEGIVQLLFFEGAPCETSYAARSGKYQDQKHEVTLARV
jgi:dCTP deaminase